MHTRRATLAHPKCSAPGKIRPGSIRKSLILALHSSVDHYENFPVASLLFPAALRPAVASIYWFARSADDIADEGTAPASVRLASLQAYRQQLSAIASHEPLDHPAFKELADHIRRHNLPLQCFHDLLTAFEMDCTIKRYETDQALLNYCKHSANPVGQLVLSLVKQNTREHMGWSDSICTGLQLVNFLQDIRNDWAIGRLYIPLEKLRAQGVSEDDITVAHASGALAPGLLAVLRAEHRRAESMLRAGAPLVQSLSRKGQRRLALEIRATLAGGQSILDRLALQNWSGLAKRPTLRRRDWVKIAWRTLFPSGFGSSSGCGD